MAEPHVVENPQEHRFEMYVDADLAGYAVYERADGITSFTHTQIEPGFEGRGLGSVLARGALDATRAAGLAALPYCPFIRHFIQKHPEYAELVPADRRAEFEITA